MKKIVLLVLAFILMLVSSFRITDIQANEGQLTHSAVLATGALRGGGYEFTNGHLYSKHRSFQKKTEKGWATVLMAADEKGEEVKSFFIIVPFSDRDEAKNLILASVVYLAFARGAKMSNILDAEKVFSASFWPQEVSRFWGADCRMIFKKFGIAVAMKNMGNGKVQIEVQ